MLSSAGWWRRKKEELTTESPEERPERQVGEKRASWNRGRKRAKRGRYQLRPVQLGGC